MLPRRFSSMSPRCRKRMLQQRLKKIPNETRSEIVVVRVHHVSELRCHYPLLLRLYDVFNLRSHNLQLVGFIKLEGFIKLSNHSLHYSIMLISYTNFF